MSFMGIITKKRTNLGKNFLLIATLVLIMGAVIGFVIFFRFHQTAINTFNFLKNEDFLTEDSENVAILKQIFGDSEIKKGGRKDSYIVIGRTKALPLSSATPDVAEKKEAIIKTTSINFSEKFKDSVVAVYSVSYPEHNVAPGLREKLYITVFRKSENQYQIYHDQEIMFDDKPFDGSVYDPIISDIEIESVQPIDINKDRNSEIRLDYQTGISSGINKKSIALLQWQDDQFKVILQQDLAANTENYEKLHEVFRENYGSEVQSMISPNHEYEAIFTTKKIYKSGGYVLNPPREKLAIAIWDEAERKYRGLLYNDIAENFDFSYFYNEPINLFSSASLSQLPEGEDKQINFVINMYYELIDHYGSGYEYSLILEEIYKTVDNIPGNYGFLVAGYGFANAFTSWPQQNDYHKKVVDMVWQDNNYIFRGDEGILRKEKINDNKLIVFAANGGVEHRGPAAEIEGNCKTTVTFIDKFTFIKDKNDSIWKIDSIENVDSWADSERDLSSPEEFKCYPINQDKIKQYQ